MSKILQTLEFELPNKLQYAITFHNNKRVTN